ncbi:4-(cytidine 5'-diphospho)-2-C-methyl-D-erythritol kinase [bacterium]|nr:4-(cytidine 5'-diphospho)-2-C-methyl-D-erythritol kinase [bacterium]
MTMAESTATFELAAPAKINVFMEVIGKRPDGYHEVETVMLRTDFADRLRFAPSDRPGIELTCSDPSLPTDGRNLVVKAAELFRREFGVTEGCRIHLEKHVPYGSGLGGGSSDAATAIMGLDRLWGTNLSREAMASLGARVGSDVAFFFDGPAALCRGRGEIVTGLSLTESFHFVLFCPAVHCGTAEIFSRVRRTGDLMDATPVIRALAEGSPQALAAGLFNRLQEATESFAPELRAIPKMLRDVEPALLGVLMTGSGSAYFGLAESRAAAEAAADQLTRPGHGIVRVLTCGP